MICDTFSSFQDTYLSWEVEQNKFFRTLFKTEIYDKFVTNLLETRLLSGKLLYISEKVQ